MPRLTRARHVDERGAAAIIMAISLALIMVAAGMILDFGIARLDRQADKSAADAAVMAGLKASDNDNNEIYTERAVCGAVDFLRANIPALGGLASAPCTPASGTSLKTCNPSSPKSATSMTKVEQSVTSGGVTYNVLVQMPYLLAEGNFPEESLTSLATDPGAANQNGCDQLAVIITSSRKAGMGSIAGVDNIATRIRSVGRVHIGDGIRAPALLLLERTKCSVLIVGSNGSPSSIRVHASGGVPGSIHADSNGTGTDCGSGSNEQLFQGHQANAIEAFAGSPSEPGIITSVATYNNVAPEIVYDGLLNVHGLTSANTPVPPYGQNRVTRGPVDDRYAAGVRTTLNSIAGVWSMNPNNAMPQGWQKTGCTPTAADLAWTGSLYIDCDSPTIGKSTAPVTFQASSLVFSGFIKGGGVHMPNATSVYVANLKNSADAFVLNGGDAFCLQATACNSSNLVQGECPTAAGTNKAKLFVRTGSISQNGGLLRMCHTTVYLMGGQNDGCVPVTNATAPTLTPCPTSTSTTGTGQVKVTGGAIDWSAPNAYADIVPLADKPTAWGGGEDLALWAESSTNSSTKFTMSGGGGMRVVGIFMTPNARPFELSGGANQGLTNAQFIATTFSLGGNANLSMTVDPDNAVTVPKQDMWTLVR